jgi:hypothetical protein
MGNVYMVLMLCPGAMSAVQSMARGCI